MCELLALSSRQPATLSLSLEEFARRGGRTAHHADGWGIATYEGRAAQVIREPKPASESALVRFLLQTPMKGTLFISHIRHATQGGVSLCNTQPFTRELAGRDHVFAHNGDIKGLEPGRRYRPVGQTDSEIAFCLLLEVMARLWEGGEPSLEARLDAFAGFAAEMGQRGPANFLYSDSDTLFVHGHKRIQADGNIHPPGIHLLQRHCRLPAVHDMDSVVVETHQAEQDVVLLASVPLTDEGWEPLDEGEVLAVRGGMVVARS